MTVSCVSLVSEPTSSPVRSAVQHWGPAGFKAHFNFMGPLATASCGISTTQRWAQGRLQPGAPPHSLSENVQRLGRGQCWAGSRLTPPRPAALHLYQQRERFPAQHQRLSLGCPILDGLLGGGLPLEGITELAGHSSAGKTQLALQLCLAVQFPQRHGGLEAGECPPPS